MRLLNDFEPQTNLKPCKVGTIIAELEEADQATLVDALKDTQKWSNRALANALQARGIGVVTDTIRAHRLNTCPCRRLK